jgi:hypothetical protein
MRPPTGKWASFRKVRRGQLDRPFWRRAGIWWLHLLIGLLFVAPGLVSWLSGASPGVGVVLQLAFGALALASVPFAYRQNRADRMSVERAGTAAQPTVSGETTK